MERLDRIGEIPHDEVWVHCSWGYRAGFAASIVDRSGRPVMLVDDEFDRARAEQLVVTLESKPNDG
ncbi:MAG: hypothetical protein KDB72_13380 [Mycobacterium sp.]|nr:hypothetical protein [Mycobacterium sp.]